MSCGKEVRFADLGGVVLHGSDRCDGASLREMTGVDVAEAEVPDQALLTQRRERLEALGEGLTVRGFHGADAQVDQVEAVHAQAIEVASTKPRMSAGAP